jgi:hypothetical protein
MSRAVRIVLTWLLAAALPLQGAAAASMTLCGTLGDGAPVAHHSEVSGDASTATAGSPAVHASVHAHAGHAAEAASGEAGATCSVCAACCAGMALRGADFMLVLVGLSDSFSAGLGTGLAPFFSEGLERPPRTSSSA